MPSTRGGPHPIRIGCSGWNYAHWRNGVFYPPRCAARNWLRFYARYFDTVEVNSTFYRLPRASSVARWVEESPPEFTFAVKVSRYITHVKRLVDAHEHLPLLFERIAPLRASPKLGPLLWQLPPTFARDDARLREALAQFPRELRHAVEFRHDSWFDPQTLELLADHGVALVVAGSPVESEAGFSYVRFHRGLRGRRGNYSDAELAEWAEMLRRRAARGDVYAYFNNDWEGFAPRNASRLRELLGIAAYESCGP